MPNEPAHELLRRVRALSAAAPLFDAIGEGGTEAVFLVGGAVRDLLLGREPLDLDLAVDGSPGELTHRFGGAVEIHDRFGTATLGHRAQRYDIAQTRTERYPAPGALPQVRPAPIGDDLRRRDFTVNAMALGLTGPQAGELVTVDGALADLEARRLTVLHDRSFADDPTRLLRLARYAARLDFTVAPHTHALARSAIAARALATVSGARIGNELRLLAGEADPVAAMASANALGLDRAIDPSLAFGEDRQHLAREALEHLPPDGSPAVLVLGVALLGAEQHTASALLDRLEFTASDRDAIAETASGAERLVNALAAADTGSAIAHAIGAAGVATVALAAVQGPPSRPRRWLSTLRHQSLQITGNDLIDRGIPEGPELGRRLAAARDAMWDGTAPDRESQLAVALAEASGPPSS